MRTTGSDRPGSALNGGIRSIFVMAAVVLAGGIGIEAAALEALVEFEMGRGAPAHPGASISSPSMEPATPPTTTLPPRPTGRPEKHPSKLSIGLGALIALAVAAGLLAWVLIDRSDDDQAAATTPTTAAAAPTLGSAPAETLSKPAFQTVAALRAAAAINPNPIYWAGARQGRRLEFSQTSGGTVYVRYLPTGTAAGTLEPYLTVATYPRPNGYAEVQAAAKNEGSKSFEVAEGGLAVYDPASPTNVHIGFPGKAYQIEVFAPEKGLALRLVTNEKIKAVP